MKDTDILRGIVPVTVNLHTCVKCREEIMCEGCGLVAATRFGAITITDELREIPHDLCERCSNIWKIAPEDRVPADRQAAEWADMTLRNDARAYPPQIAP